MYGYGLEGLRERIPGPAGTVVRLGFRTQQGQFYEVDLPRNAYGGDEQQQQQQQQGPPSQQTSQQPPVPQHKQQPMPPQYMSAYASQMQQQPIYTQQVVKQVRAHTLSFTAFSLFSSLPLSFLIL